LTTSACTKIRKAKRNFKDSGSSKEILYYNGIIIRSGKKKEGIKEIKPAKHVVSLGHFLLIKNEL